VDERWKYVLPSKDKLTHVTSIGNFSLTPASPLNRLCTRSEECPRVGIYETITSRRLLNLFFFCQQKKFGLHYIIKKNVGRSTTVGGSAWTSSAAWVAPYQTNSPRWTNHKQLARSSKPKRLCAKPATRPNSSSLFYRFFSVEPPRSRSVNSLQSRLGSMSNRIGLSWTPHISRRFALSYSNLTLPTSRRSFCILLQRSSVPLLRSTQK